MSEELLQRDLLKNPYKIGKWGFYNIGATTIKQLKEASIIRNIDYGNIEKKKVDGIIVKNKNVIAIIENKKPSNFNTETKKKKAITQELEVAKKLKSKILIVTDTKETIWINVLTANKIKDENGQALRYNFDYKDKKLPEIIEKILNSINEKNDQIKPKKLVNPTDLAKQIWQDIWSVSGATPENCLYTFVELFIFKYLSDLGVLKGIYNFEALLNMYKTNTPDEVLEHYAKTIRPKIKELFPKSNIDNTTIINGTIFVSKDQKAVKGYSTVFKKVLERFRDYGKLEYIDYDFKSKLFESFLKEGISKKNWGQFFTPLKVVRAIVEMAKDEIKEGISICDPACGVGKFLLEPIKTKINQFYEIRDNKLISKITLKGFDKGFDKDEQKTIILAKANMLIYFSDLIKENPELTQEFAKLFNETFILKTNSILGTLSEPAENEFDLILTNPPYVTSGSSNLKEEIKKVTELQNYYKINAMGVEGLFMEWIIKALKPGGKAFIIVPDGIFNRVNDVKLRKFILDECIIDAIISLPEKTFFTTPKKTYILAVTKKIDKTPQKEPVFTYLVSEIGESRDVYRFEIEQNDLNEAVELFLFFKSNKLKFDKINSDKRCKIQPISKFIESVNNSWIIDNWWSKEEKIELGIEEKQEMLDVFEFSVLIKDVSNTIKDLSEELEEFQIEKNRYAFFKKVNISDDKYFELTRGKRITKKTIEKHKGDVPVYSSSKDAKSILGKIDEKFLIDNNLILFTEPSVTFNLDGSVGFCFLRTDKKYSFIDVVAAIKPKTKDIDLEFLLFELQKAINKTGANYQSKLYFNKIKNYNITLNIPIKPNGEFDLKAQKEIALMYKKIDEIKQAILKELDKIEKVKIEL
jgi:type I restriction-modification system DNA methylase subunit